MRPRYRRLSSVKPAPAHATALDVALLIGLLVVCAIAIACVEFALMLGFFR